MVAVAVDAPLECKGGGAHGGVVVLVATVGAVVESFKGTSKTWSRYWSSPAFRCRSGDREISMCRWAKLQLPTGQNCYSAWKEKEKPLEKRRTARNVKVHCTSATLVLLLCFLLTLLQVFLDNETRLAEVSFFIHLCYNGDEKALTLVSLFSNPDPTLLQLSVNTLWSCEYIDDSALKFIDVKCIHAVVAMVPHVPVIVK